MIDETVTDRLALCSRNQEAEQLYPVPAQVPAQVAAHPITSGVQRQHQSCCF